MYNRKKRKQKSFKEINKMTEKPGELRSKVKKEKKSKETDAAIERSIRQEGGERATNCSPSTFLSDQTSKFVV